LNGPTTLLQTVAISGGLKKGAKPRAIIVFRTVNNQRTAAKFDLTAIRRGQAEDPVLAGGDIVVVESSGVRTAFSDILTALPVFSVFTAL
jgi:polysaccharide export outer membrane protein